VRSAIAVVRCIMTRCRVLGLDSLGLLAVEQQGTQEPRGSTGELTWFAGPELRPDGALGMDALRQHPQSEW
jgi:hypothetical protein